VQIPIAPLLTWIAALTAAVLAVIIGRAQGFQLVGNDFVIQGAIMLVACPLAFALYGVLRPEFALMVTPFHCFAQLAAFNGAVWFLQFPLASLALPTIDAPLARIDEMFGAYWPDHIKWMMSHPMLFEAMGLIYRSLLFQIPVACLILGILDPRRLRVLVLANTIGLSATVALATIIPAGGAVYHFGNPFDAADVAQFQTVREGTLRLLDPKVISGIIAFPSYHTLLAVLIALSFKGLPRVFPFVLLLDIAIIFTTRGTGGHHYGDIVAGIVVAILANWGAAHLLSVLEARPIRIGLRLRRLSEAS
jgi:hypothetical protein